MILVAHIPYLEMRHLKWFAKYQQAPLFLIPEDIISDFLASNLDTDALPVEIMEKILLGLDCPPSVRSVEILDVEKIPKVSGDSASSQTYIFPDEPVSRFVVEKYFTGIKGRVLFEKI